MFRDELVEGQESFVEFAPSEAVRTSHGTGQCPKLALLTTSTLLAECVKIKTGEEKS